MRARILAALIFGTLATGSAWAGAPAAQKAPNNKESEMDIRMSCEKFAEDDHIPANEMSAYMTKCMQDLMSDPSEQADVPPMYEDLAASKPSGVITGDKLPALTKPAGGGALTVEKIPVPTKSTTAGGLTTEKIPIPLKPAAVALPAAAAAGTPSGEKAQVSTKSATGPGKSAARSPGSTTTVPEESSANTPTTPKLR
ncbi:MAG: hypothetical protein HQL64_02345 [Magnetococcales bacterium]|nr:hypothetical protein [Magnetococcales bacterium]